MGLLNWPPPDHLWKMLAMSAMRLDDREPAEIPGNRPKLCLDVLALDMARLLQPLSKRAQTLHVVVKRCDAEEADHRECRLLRARRQRPRRRRAAEQPDQLAPPHGKARGHG